MSVEDKLRALLAEGKDAAPLRVSLAQACLARGDTADAIANLERAVELNGNYSAAWKLYGRALLNARREREAGLAWKRGIQVAAQRGDRQAEREMKVFLRRLEKQRS